MSLLDAADTNAEEIVEIGQACRRAARRGGELIQRLLSFSRRQSLHPQSNNINTLINDLSVLLQRTLGESIDIVIDLDSQLPNALVDSNQLETCLVNLALNARDAMPDGGRLTIRTARFSQHAAHDTLLVSVTDEGVGMPKEVADRAFEPFFSTKAKGSGTGLGLSMVYGFVNQSGGDIEIQSSINQGTTINILLPAEIAGEPAPEEEANLAVESFGPAHILLVEDEPDVRDYITRAPQAYGIQYWRGEQW